MLRSCATASGDISTSAQEIIGSYTTGMYLCIISNYRLTDKIPVIFHDLKSYDSHFIMQMIGEIANKHIHIKIKKRKRNRWKSM